MRRVRCLLSHFDAQGSHSDPPFSSHQRRFSLSSRTPEFAAFFSFAVTIVGLATEVNRHKRRIRFLSPVLRLGGSFTPFFHREDPQPFFPPCEIFSRPLPAIAPLRQREGVGEPLFPPRSMSRSKLQFGSISFFENQLVLWHPTIVCRHT